MSRRTQRALWGLAALLACFPLVPTAGGRDVLQTVVELCCLAVAWRYVLARRDVLSQGWGLLVAAVTALGGSDALMALEIHVVHVDTHPRPSNVLALVGYAMLGAGVVQLERNRSRGRRMPGGIESLIFGVGAATPVLVFLILPVLAADRFSVAARSTTVAYAVADLVVITVIARLLLSDGRQSRSFFFLFTALFVSLAGDFWSGISTDQGPASESVSIKMLWLAAFVLFAAGVAHPSMRTFTQGGAWADDAPSERRVWLMGLGQAIPFLTLGVSWLTGDSLHLLVVAVGGLVVSALVSARFVGLLEKISEQSVQLAALVKYDELTGLHNRRSWNHELSRACADARDRDGSLCVAMLDVDNFKSYNDTYGHPAGDQLLHEAAAVWRELLRPGDVLARYGGEEFAVIMPETGSHAAVALMDRLRLATPGGQTVSAGVAVWEHATDPSKAISAADHALYRAKRSGRNRVLSANPRDLAGIPEQLSTLRVVVQPIVAADDLRVVGYEALSRFPHVGDVAEVFRQAHCAQYGDLLEAAAIRAALAHPGRPEGVELFVNVSERAMRSARFWGAMPEEMTGIVVELHEDRDDLDDETVARYLDRFRDRGARICLDDLVAGASDLTRIVSLRPDVVKIDRSLIQHCDTARARAEVVELLAGFARAHGVTVVAEGVETPGELAVVREAGVDTVQGFLVGRPEPGWVSPLVAPPRCAVATVTALSHRPA